MPTKDKPQWLPREVTFEGRTYAIADSGRVFVRAAGLSEKLPVTWSVGSSRAEFEQKISEKVAQKRQELGTAEAGDEKQHSCIEEVDPCSRHRVLGSPHCAYPCMLFSVASQTPKLAAARHLTAHTTGRRLQVNMAR